MLVACDSSSGGRPILNGKSVELSLASWNCQALFMSARAGQGRTRKKHGVAMKLFASFDVVGLHERGHDEEQGSVH